MFCVRFVTSHSAASGREIGKLSHTGRRWRQGLLGRRRNLETEWNLVQAADNFVRSVADRAKIVGPLSRLRGGAGLLGVSKQAPGLDIEDRVLGFFKEVAHQRRDILIGRTVRGNIDLPAETLAQE